MTTGPQLRGSHAWTSVLLVAAMAVGGIAACSGDPTTSDEYQTLATQLAAMTAERDALAAAAAETPWAELPAPALEAFDGYTQAVLDADGEAMLEYVTDGFTFLSYGTEVSTLDEYANTVDMFYTSFELETLGGLMVLGGGDTYIVAEPERATTPAWVTGFSVLRLVNVDGTWLVDAHRFTGE